MARRRVAGAVDRLPSGRWRARYTGPDGHRHAAVLRTKGEADAWLSTQQTDRRRGNWIDPRLGRRTVADWADVWLATTVHLRPTTRAGYEGKVRTHILPLLGDRPVAELDTPAIRRYVAELTAEGVHPNTIIGIRAVLRLILATAVEAGALAVNPCTGIKVARPVRREMHFLTAEDVELLAHAITHPPVKPAGHGANPHWRTHLPEYGLLVRLAAYSGLRAGEITALKVGRIDFLRSSLQVAESASEVNGTLMFGPTKNYQVRTVPIPPFLRDQLAAHLRDHHGPEDLVFTGPEGGPLRYHNFFTRHFKPAVHRAGLANDLRFHDLRHSYGGFLIAQGAHPRAIMERMGHSSIQVTLGTYGHLLPGIDEHLTDGLDRLGRAAQEAHRGAGPDFVRSRGGHAEVIHMPPADQK